MGHIVQPASCCSSQSRRKEPGTTSGVRCWIIGAPTSTSLSLERSIPTCPQRTLWSPQSGGGFFLPWSGPDGQAGASCCGCNGCKGLQSPGALCDDARGFHPAGWRWHPRWTVGSRGAGVTFPFPVWDVSSCSFSMLLKPPSSPTFPRPQHSSLYLINSILGCY